MFNRVAVVVRAIAKFWNLELGTWNLEPGTWNQHLGCRAKPAPGLYHGPSAVKNETATLRDQVVNDFAVDIRQPEIAARVAIGESLVVEAE